MKRSYDSIAALYDRLSRLIYGTTLLQAQAYLIQAIPPASRILIIGGGTGWILEEITRAASTRHYITYIDSSKQMIALSQKRETGANKVTFVTATVQDANLMKEYDVVMTPFFLDNFADDTFQKVFSRIDAALAPKGLWLYCDFRNTNVWWQKVLLRAMYLFFRTLCGIEARRLSDAHGCFTRYGYKVNEEQTFLKGFVLSRVYQKE